MISTKQRGFLTGLASKDAVSAQLGKGGPTEAFAAQLATLLERHELVKVKFVDFKDQKKEISADLAEATSSELVRVIGNTAIFFRRNPDPEKRSIELP
ncbi:YhbY family RNA-binding protein [bacterium]|nr:YhbY family RNA-binding protein [bacterium]